MTKELFTFVLLSIPLAGLASVRPASTYDQAGASNIAENVCPGDLFGNGCGAGKFIRFVTYDNNTLAMLSSSIPNAPATIVGVTRYSELTGGTYGAAIVSAMENQPSESTVPESGTLALVGIGMICLGGLLRHRH